MRLNEEIFGLEVCVLYLQGGYDKYIFLPVTPEKIISDISEFWIDIHDAWKIEAHMGDARSGAEYFCSGLVSFNCGGHLLSLPFISSMSVL